MASTVLLRIRRFVARRGLTVALVLVVVGAGSLGWAGWVATHPPTSTITEETHEQTIRSVLSTSATTTGETELYAPGTRLHNESVYLREAAPTVTLSLRTSVPEGTRVRQRLSLVFGFSRDGDTFWRDNRTLTRTQATAESGTVVSQVELNVTDLGERLTEIRAAAGDVGSLTVALRVRVHYDTGRYEGTLSSRLPVSVSPRWYSVPTQTFERTRSTETTETVTTPRSRLSYLVPAAGGTLAGVAALGVALAWRRLRDADVSELTRRIQRRTHDEWISEGSLAGVDADRTVTVASIEDLVDIAIDADRRVIYDPTRGLYAVIDDVGLYVHRPADEWQWQDDPLGQ